MPKKKKEGKNMYSEGYVYGVTDVYYALMTTEDTVASAPAYDTPAVLGKDIGLTITPVYKENKVYASNFATRMEKRVDHYNVSLNIDHVPFDTIQTILGRTTDSKGVQHIVGGNQAPYLALIFALTLDNNQKELYVLYKGKLSEPTINGATDGETTSYQHPTLEGYFIRRMNDDKLAAMVESGKAGVDATVVTTWFGSVYEEPASST